MERFSRNPVAVFIFFAAAFYLTALGYVLDARGENTTALVSTLLAYVFALLIVRAAEKPVR